VSKERVAWTFAELDEVLPRLRAHLDAVEANQEEHVQPLPAMTVAECREYLNRVIDCASERVLSQRECFVFGMLLANYQMAVTAEVLGKKGRYYVISEENGLEVIHQLRGAQP
jgi:hypothetical protein